MSAKTVESDRAREDTRRDAVAELRAAEVCLMQASRLLYCEPDAQTVARFAVERPFRAVPFGGQDADVAHGAAMIDRWCCQACASAADASDLPDPSGPGAGSDAVSVERLVKRPAFRQKVDELKREWLRLFVGWGTPEASCLESFYTDPSSCLFAPSTLEVRRAYRAHGLQVEHLHNEPDDHLGLMLGFVGELVEEQAQTLESGDADAARALADEQEAFLTEHVLPWLAVWRYRVDKHATSDYYRGVGAFTFGLCARFVQRFGIRYDAADQRFVRRRSDGSGVAVG